MSTGESRVSRIVVIGSINMDLVIRCEKIARPGETISGRTLEEIPGGKGANQAVAAARLGATVTLVGRVGDDAFGQLLRDGLEREGIDLRFVWTTAGTSSGVAVIQVDDGGQNSIVVIPGANAALTPADVWAAESAIAEADAVLLQFEIPQETVAAAVLLARRHSVRVIVDPAPAREDVDATVLSADWLLPNETEAERLTGLPVQTADEACAAAASLKQRGCLRSVITRGEHGVIMADADGELWCVEPYRVVTVDTTAAGDAFAAGLAIGLSQGQSDAEAVRYACAAGASAATRPGAQPAMPSKRDVERLMREQPESGRLSRLPVASL